MVMASPSDFPANCNVYTPYIGIYVWLWPTLVISLPIVPYIHRFYVALADPPLVYITLNPNP